MKYAKFFYLIAFLFALSACKKDFLDKRPLDNLTDASFYQSPQQLLQATAPLYNAVWFFANYKAVQSIEQRANTLFWNGNAFKNFNVSSTNSEVSEAWQSYYNVVGHTNLIIQNIKAYTPATVPASAKNHALAEARFMRGLAYSVLVDLWGAVPVIENNLTLLTDTTQRRNTIESVWEFIMKDMQFAADNLMEVSPLKGRLNKYAGKAMLARMYLTHAGVGMPGNGTRRQSDLDKAADLCREVIAQGPYKMLDDYEELFKMANNNNSESILALQWVFNGGWGTQNALQSYVAFSGSITGVGDGWGAQIGAGFSTLQLYEDFAKDKRRRATFMFPGDKYSYITNLVNGVREPLVVPYNAQNSYVGYNDQDVPSSKRSEFAWVKKYVVGRPEDNDGQVIMQGTGINTYMMRLAEVHLILAEAILGNNAATTNAEALTSFNKVRRRAIPDAVAFPNKTSITWNDIYRERMLEFAMENMSAFDFSRLHYYNPQKAYDMLSAMNRGYYWIKPLPDIMNATSWELTDRVREDQNDFKTINANNFYLPIPDGEIVKAPSLKNPPVPYVPK